MTGHRGQDVQSPTWALQGSNNPSRPTNQMSKKCPRCHSVVEGAQKHLWRASFFCKHTAPAGTAPFLRQEPLDPGISGFYPASVPIGRQAAPPPASAGRRLGRPRWDAAATRPPVEAAAAPVHLECWLMDSDCAVGGGRRRRRRRRRRGAPRPRRLRRCCVSSRRRLRHGGREAVGQCHAAAASRSAGAPRAPSHGAGSGDRTSAGAASPLMATPRSPAVGIMLHDYKSTRMPLFRVRTYPSGKKHRVNRQPAVKE